MSFGFSVGEFIAVARLATTIYKALDEVSGPKSDFKDTTEQPQSLYTNLETICHLIVDPAFNIQELPPPDFQLMG